VSSWLLTALCVQTLRVVVQGYKSIFDGHGQVPTKGLLATQRFALEPSLSINWPYCIALSMPCHGVSVSKPFSNRLEHL
jgi:hypothetical protein